MKFDRKMVVPAVLAAAGVAVIVWFVVNYDRVPVEIRTGYQGEARGNSLLAAERFLDEVGFEARSERGLAAMPAPDATVIWAATRRLSFEREQDELLDWVRSGGHLVLVAPRFNDDEVDFDNILAAIGVEHRSRRHEAGDGETFHQPVVTASGLRVAFDHRHVLESSRRVRALAKDGHGVHALVAGLGQGQVTVLSDGNVIRNAHIGQHDHAAFLWRTVAERQGGEVVLVHAPAALSLIDLMIAYALPVLVSTLVLLGVWLWAVSRRLGPLLPAHEPGRRRLMEHVEASGRFLWRVGHGEDLLRDARASVRRSLDFRHPGWRESPELHERLASISGLTQAQVRAALEDENAARDAFTFTETVRMIEAIRRSL